MTKQIAVRLPEAIDARLEALAEKTGRTKTFYVREAIETHLDSLEKQFLSDRIVMRLADSDSPWLDQGPDFAEECRRQSVVLRGDPHEAEILSELESVADTREWT